MSLARALALNTSVQLIGKAISTVFGILVVGIMTRYLGQTGFGIYTAANAYLQIFAFLLDLGINVTFTALLGEHAHDEAYEKRCVSALFTLRFIMAVLFFILAPLLWFTLFPHEMGMLLAIIALNGSIFFPSLNQILIGVQQRHLKMHIPAIAEIVGRIVLLTGLLFARHLGWSLVSVIWLVSLGSLANFLFTLAFTRYPGRVRFSWDPKFWHMVLKRSWPVALSVAFNLVYFKADTIILSVVRSPAEVGVYGAAYRVLEILITVPFMYAGVLLPVLSSIQARKDHARFSYLIGRSLEIMFFLICPMIVGTVILGPKIMSLVAGPDFAISGYVLRILIFAVGFIYLNTMTSYAIVALDIQRRMIPVYITVSLVTLTGYLIFIPRYGMWAAAILTVFSEASVAIASFTVTYLRLPYSVNWRTILATLASAAAMGLVLRPLESHSIALTIPLSALIYTGLLIGLGAITKDSLKEILSLKKPDAEVEII